MNEIVVKTILEHIPANTKPTARVMEILGISRESAYRRFRQEILFSFEEITKLALALNFSIDKIIEGNKKETFAFDLQSKLIQSPYNIYIAQFYEHDRHLKRLVASKDAEVLVALNELPPLFYIFSEQLFKFNYFQWLYTHSPDSIHSSFSELTMPSELHSIREKTLANITKINNVSIIVSPYIFLNLVRNIQYYYLLKQLTPTELLLLKNEMLSFIALTESLAQNGYFTQDCRVDFYLSSLNINSNTLSLKYDETYQTHYYLYPNNPLIIRDPEICSMQKEWFQSLKKQSRLITLSNEILKKEFYTKQREYAERYLSPDAIITCDY
jgi:hypothetical protein